MNSIALVHQAAPPLTSHYPLVTSCSPGKRGEQLFFGLNTSNRTNAIFPIQMSGVGAQQRMLTSFTNAVKGGHQLSDNTRGFGDLVCDD